MQVAPKSRLPQHPCRGGQWASRWWSDSLAQPSAGSLAFNMTECSNPDINTWPHLLPVASHSVLPSQIYRPAKFLFLYRLTKKLNSHILRSSYQCTRVLRNWTWKEGRGVRMVLEAVSRSGWRSSRPSLRLRDPLRVAWNRHVDGWRSS